MMDLIYYLIFPRIFVLNYSTLVVYVIEDYNHPKYYNYLNDLKLKRTFNRRNISQFREKEKF